ncbi:MAG: penicillin-binding transpeptidase domain-containing protein [Anaerolineales bacterium]|jgi:penicillin-binding protein 2
MKTSAQKNYALFTMLIIALLASLAACSLGTANVESTGSPSDNGGASGTPGEVVPTIVSVPDPSAAAREYLNAWDNGDYETMYNMLTTLSRDAVSFEEFNQRYLEVEQQAVLVGVDHEIQQVLTNPAHAEVGYQVVLQSSLVGSLDFQTQMNLSLENGAWKVVWDEHIIIPELAGGNRLSMETIWPTRGIIYDHNGTTLAADTRAVALFIIPSAVEEDQRGSLFSALQQATGINAAYWDYVISDEDNPFVIPLIEIPFGQFEEYEDVLSNHYNALGAEVFDTRLDYINAAGAHSVGWVGPIPVEEVDQWAERGYPVGATIGRSGVEAWGEEMLAGRPSADLYVVTSDNLLLTRLATTETVPSQSIYTTLDRDMQRWAQLSLQGFTGAVVALERDTGKVLAIASSPTFDPNYADFDNPNSLWDTYFPDNAGRFFNRATQGQYPPGSIFKVVSMAAAVETGEFEPTDRLDCGYYWFGPGDVELTDWTLDKERPSSGNLSLVEGLMRSCNIWFYEVGYRLYTAGEVDAIAEMARGFGLGSPTGIDIFPEESGQIMNPDDQEGAEAWFNAVQQAIGQSNTTITPIQAAVYTAALGNGGTLYRPQMIERVENTAGEATFEFTPVVNGELPISEETLSSIQQGMLSVTRNERGTAYFTFVNRLVSVYGKTGTAQNPGEDPHAWFIGYTDEQDPDNPDIAIAVLIENQGDGSEFSAPIFRRLMEVYFYGRPLSAFPWEDRIGEIDERYFMTPEELEALEAEEAAAEEGNNNGGDGN